MLQQDSALAHKAKMTQTSLTRNLAAHWSPAFWPPQSLDCNPLDMGGTEAEGMRTASHECGLSGHLG